MAFQDNPKYVDAYTKAQELHLKLYGAKDSLAGGLASDMAKFRENPKFGVNSEPYKKAKAAFDSAQKEYDKQNLIWQTIKEKADAEIAAAKKIKDDAKASTDAHITVANAQSIVNGLQETNAPAAAIAAAQQVLTDAKNAANAAEITSGGKGSFVDSLGVKPSDKMLSDYQIYTDTSGNTFVTGMNKSGKFDYNSAQEWVFYPEKGGVTPTQDINAARKSVMAQLGGLKNLPTILTSLRNGGFISAADAKSGNYIDGLNNAIRSYSVKALDEYQQSNGAVNFPAMDSFFKKNSGYGLDKTTTATEKYTTLRSAADRDINLYLLDATGYPATAAQKEDYWTRVVKAEKDSFNTVKTATDSTGATKDRQTTVGQMSPADYEVIKATVAKKALAGTTVEALLNNKSKTPGQVVTDINTAMKYASDYGLDITTQQALGFVADAFGQKDYITKVQDRIKQMAITLHPNFSDHIQAGGTVKDVTDIYGNAMSKKLNIVVKDSTKDKRIMDAATNKVSLSAWDRMMQGMPEWAVTPEAHNIGADFTNTILSSFGFGGN